MGHEVVVMDGFDVYEKVTMLYMLPYEDVVKGVSEDGTLKVTQLSSSSAAVAPLLLKKEKEDKARAASMVDVLNCNGGAPTVTVVPIDSSRGGGGDVGAAVGGGQQWSHQSSTADGSIERRQSVVDLVDLSTLLPRHILAVMCRRDPMYWRGYIARCLELLSTLLKVAREKPCLQAALGGSEQQRWLVDVAVGCALIAGEPPWALATGEGLWCWGSGSDRHPPVGLEAHPEGDTALRTLILARGLHLMPVALGIGTENKRNWGQVGEMMDSHPDCSALLDAIIDVILCTSKHVGNHLEKFGRAGDQDLGTTEWQNEAATLAITLSELAKVLECLAGLLSSYAESPEMSKKMSIFRRLCEGEALAAGAASPLAALIAALQVGCMKPSANPNSAVVNRWPRFDLKGQQGSPISDQPAARLMESSGGFLGINIDAVATQAMCGVVQLITPDVPAIYVDALRSRAEKLDGDDSGHTLRPCCVKEVDSLAQLLVTSCINCFEKAVDEFLVSSKVSLNGLDCDRLCVALKCTATLSEDTRFRGQTIDEGALPLIKAAAGIDPKSKNSPLWELFSYTSEMFAIHTTMCDKADQGCFLRKLRNAANKSSLTTYLRALETVTSSNFQPVSVSPVLSDLMKNLEAMCK